MLILLTTTVPEAPAPEEEASSSSAVGLGILTAAAGKTTELVAVNAILAAAGEAPVSSIIDEAGVDSSMALATLRNAMLQVLSVGWSFNTRKITFAPTGTQNEYLVPDSVLRLDSNDNGQTQYTVRGGRIFDMLTGLSTGFTNSLELEVVEALEWCDLPEPARQYVMRVAARMFVEQNLGDRDTARAVLRDETTALFALRRHETATGGYRVFGPAHSRIVDRGRPIRFL